MHRLTIGRILAAIACVGSLVMAKARAADDPARLYIAFTADTEGHVNPCRNCPDAIERGGIARRATLLAQLRAEHPVLITLDAGNVLFGPDSIESNGKVMVDAYDALSYGVVNLSWRDFRRGKQQTLDLLKNASVTPVSANLLDAASGQLIVRPYAVMANRVAVIGVTEAPTGMDHLPHLKEQLAGVRIRPADEALAEFLPKAKLESDCVVLLAYGGATFVTSLRQSFAADVAVILAGGVRPAQIPAIDTAAPVMVSADQHGKDVVLVTMDRGGANASTRSVPITPDIKPEPKMAALAQAKTEPRAIASAEPTPPATAPAPAPAAVPVQDPPKKPPQAATRGAARPARRNAPDAKGDAPRVAARQDRQPKGLPGVNLTAEQVNQAIDRGSEFLWKYIKSTDLDDGHTKLGDVREHLLCCLALVHSNAHKRFPDFDAQLRESLGRLNYRRIDASQTYQSGLLAMLVESYGDATYLPKLELASRYLLESQGTGGSWDYHVDVDKALLTKPPDDRVLQVSGGTALEGPDAQRTPWKRLTPWEKGKDGDSSNMQYAVLGLNAAARTGLKLPADAWQRSLKAHLERQTDDGGFNYSGGGGGAYGSMTCAGICAIAIARHWLEEPAPEEDPAIERGLAWLEKNFSVTEHPRSHAWLYYYLYSLERVGRVLDTEFVGQHEWYPLGARFLVDHQKPDGSWIGLGSESDPRLATSFALLFLTRATPTLTPEEKRGGKGTLLTSFTTPSAGRVYIILDASGSMLDEMGGRAKFDIAREAVESLVRELPETSEVALRVYGSKKRAIEVGADADTELVVPMEPLQRAKMLRILESLRARGKTPLAQSLLEAKSDLEREGKRNRADDDTDESSRIIVLLLTDGGEDTRPRKDPVRAAAELAGLKHVKLQIVGFDINREDWSEQLRAMAAASGGAYASAADGAVLAKDLRNSIMPAPDSFAVTDVSGNNLAAGKFGDRVTLPEGKYALQTSFDGRPFSQEFWINTDRSTSVTFNAANLAKAGAGAQNATPKKPPAGGAAEKRGPCAECGAALATGAKFCTSCGTKAK